MQPITPSKSIPLGVGILGVLLILAGFFNLVDGIGLLPVADPSAFGIPTLALLLGLLYLGVGIGFFKKLAPAWYISLAISFLDIVRRIILVFVFSDIISLLGIVVDLFIIVYLLQPGVHQYFNDEKRGRGTNL